MNENLPVVTIVIPARPEQAEIKALEAARAMDYPADRLEVIIARGKQPSVQRNTAMRAARGELIYFLDDDSVPIEQNLRRGIGHFADPAVQMVGGPNLCPKDAPGLEQVFALVLGSWLAFGPSRARYTAVGSVRTSGEKELILCNLLARRQSLLQHGGFNEALYPNEENALMDELQKRGGKLVYDPGLIVYRRPRPSLKAFARMLRTYGRGRAEQFRAHPTFGSALNFIPPLFCVYLLFLAVATILNRAQPAWFAPLALYAVAVLGQTLALIPRGGVLRALGALPLIVLTHVLYGFGFWKGLFTSLRTGDERPVTTVDLETR